MADYLLAGEEMAPEGNTQSLDFERVVNAYSIATTKAQLVQQGILEEEEIELTETASSSYGSGYDSVKKRHARASAHHAEHHHLHTPSGKVFVRWLLTLGTGLVCGLVAILILFCVQKIGGFRAERLNRQLQWASGNAVEAEIEAFYTVTRAFDRYARTFKIPGVFFEYAAFNLLLALASSVMCLVWAPLAIGSGIPEVKAYLNGVCVPSFADLHVFAAKIVATVLAVSSGLIVGPEGPLVYVGAIIGQGITKTSRIEHFVRHFQVDHPRTSAGLGCARIGVFGKLEKSRHRGSSTTASKNGESKPLLHSISEDEGSEEKDCCQSTVISRAIAHLSKFRNDLERRDLISIGVATGFAAAFGAPVGGLLYSMEEASSYLSVALMWRTLASTAVGTLMISLYYGDLSKYSVLSLGVDITSDDQALLDRFAETPLYVLIGVATGVFGAFFNGSYNWANKRRKVFYGNPNMSKTIFITIKLIEVAIVSLLTSAATFLLPIMLPWACSEADGEYKVESEVGLSLQAKFANRFNCPAGHYNEIGSILLGSRDEAMNDILTDPTAFEARTLLTCGFTFLFLMIITFGVAMPSGMFMPTLLTGSSLGGWAGIMIQRHIMPSVAPATFALLGATGMLAGVQRTTVSLVVIMMEATGDTKVLIPMIVTVVVSRYIGDLFNEGVYHIGMELKDYLYLDMHIKSLFDVAEARTIMSSPVVTLNEVMTAEDLEAVLKDTTHNGFPIVEGDGMFVGLIRRDQIVALLECGFYMAAVSPTPDSSKHLSSMGSGLSDSNSVKQAIHRADSMHNDHALLVDADYGPDISKRPENEWLEDNVIRSRRTGSIMLGTDETLPTGAVRRFTKTRVRVGAHGCLVVEVMDDELENHVDLASAMNRGAVSVLETCPLSKAYGVFTSLGVRHLTVLGKQGKVVGMITRSNLSPEYLHEKTGISMHD